MREMFKLLISVAVFSAASGGLLAAIQSGTQDRIEYQQLQFVKGPAIEQIMDGCSNNPIEDRFKLMDGESEISFFVGVFGGRADTVALETFGKGYGGDIGVVVGVNLTTNNIVGVAVTTHSETPGLGSRAKSDPSFSAQFQGLPIKDPFKVKADGGQIDALSGATFSSRGVCGAVSSASDIYLRLKNDIVQKAKAFQS